MNAKELPVLASATHFEQEASDLVAGQASGATSALRRIHRAQRTVRRRGEAALPSARFGMPEAQLTIAHEYGFDNWLALLAHLAGLAMEESPVSQFEAAADAIISGELSVLTSLLRRNPELVRMRSTRLHHGMLLHYVSANGVEDFRQQTPKNAVPVANVLLDAGAEADGLAHTYGGGATETTLNLVLSSIHPAQAGVQVPLAETLLDHGAAINGVEDDGSPLITALAFGYTDAAEALARRGARIDTVATAAGLGREDLVRAFVTTADGQLRTNVPRPHPSWLRLPDDPQAHLELALVWAGVRGRTGVVDFLTRHGVGPDARDAWGTPLT